MYTSAATLLPSCEENCRPSAVITTIGGAWGLLLGAAACSCQDRLAIPSTGGQRAPRVVLARSALPVCGPSHDGQGCYVWSNSKFNVCRGDRGTWIETSVNDLHAARRRQNVTSDHNVR